MISCPNKNTKAWKELERKYGDFAYILWDKYQGEIPLSLYGEYPAFSRDSSIIDNLSRIVNISNNGYISTNGKPLPDYKLEQINNEIVRKNASYRTNYRLIRNKKGDYTLMNGNDFVYYNDSKDEFISINSGIAILDSFKKRLGVEYEIITPSQAEGILQDSPEPYTDEPGFFYKNKVYLVDNGQGLDFDTTVHEFAHPFVRAISKQNPSLFNSIIDQIISTPEGRAIHREVEKLGYKDFMILEEVAVRAITKLAKRNFDSSTGQLFENAVRKLLRYLATLMRNIFGKQDLKISEIDPNFTLEQIADLFSLKPGTINLNSENVVQASMKAVNILLKPNAKEVFEKGAKNGWSLDKVLTELAIPKDQKKLILDSKKTTLEEIIADLLANYSYTVEINTAKTKVSVVNDSQELSELYTLFFSKKISKEEFESRKNKLLEDSETPTQHYSNLTVPGGTNYTENEIATPAITPSIKGHAQFATDKGIGWFRSDEQTEKGTFSKETKLDDLNIEDVPNSFTLGETTFYLENEEWMMQSDDSPTRMREVGLGEPEVLIAYKSKLLGLNEIDNNITGENYRVKNNTFGIPTKTRRILEVQSDLFQKGRDKKTLISTSKIDGNPSVDEIFENEFGEFEVHNEKIGFIEGGFKSKEEAEKWLGLDTKKNHNNFLQLLNKDNNWVTFFVKSIIQDSAKKGYEKVLFPSGDTISKIEDFKQVGFKLKLFLLAESNIIKAKTLKDLDQALIYDAFFGIKDDSAIDLIFYRNENDFEALQIDLIKEIKETKKHYEAANKNTTGTINFYENTVTNILKKNYNVKQITDEYGNTWNEIEIPSSLIDTTVSFNRKNTGEGEKKESRSQKEIYSMLNPEGKITKSDAGYVVLGEIGYKRVTELVRKKFQLGNLEKSDAQVLGDLFHAQASNLIAAAFPEFNTHYKFIKLEGVPQETIININNIIKPIIEKAKKEGSVLVTELPIANTKKKIAGTIDVLEITKEGKVVMLDYKTSMNKGTVVGKYKKLAGNSQQQALYKSILAEDDPALGRESINVGYQSLMNIISYVNKAGKIQYKVQETVPVLYQNTLNKKRDEMLSILYDQIENLVGKINKDNRDKTNKLIEAKRELMVRIQKNAKDSEIIQTAAGDIAAIEAYISDNNDIDNYVEFRGDLELYRNLSSYVDVTLSKDKDALDFIQGKAARLFTELYDKSEKKISENIAKDLAIEGSPIQTAEDVMKPVRDINMYKSMAFGASYSNNPIVVGVYKKVMEKLGIVRKKSLQLADEIKKTVSDLEKYMGSVGESIYEPLLQYKDGERTGYVVDQFLPEYWNLRRKARTESDLKWFKENAEYDKEAYEKALANQKTYLESTKKARVASKIQYLKNKPEYAKNAAEKAEAFVDQEIKAEITKWVQNNNNIVQYNKPKEKWTDPKWKEIKQGKYKGTPVEKFYDLYINTMNGLEENALLPFDFRANFIADFRKSFLDRVINNGIGNMKLGKSIVDSLSVVVDEAEVNKVNPFTGEFIRRIPIAGRKVLNSQERKEFNKTEKSFDLGNSLAVFFESALRYKELSEIEKHIEISRDMLLRQKEQILNVKGEEAKGGFNLVKVSKGLDNTISQFNHFVDSAIYGKSTGNETGVEIEGNGITQALGLLEKGEKATISVSKFLDMFLKYTGLNNLGYNMYAPVTNLLGGKSMQFLQGVGGRWYGVKDYNFASIVVSAGPFSKASEDIEKANLFIEMLNPQVNEFMKDTFEDLKSENKAIKNVPGPFKAMQWSEDHMHKAGLIAMIKSNKHSVKWSEWSVENGKLVYKGDGKIEDSTMEAFRQKVLHVNGRALGNMNPDDKIMLKKWFLGRAIIQHRGWIPAMLQAHWSERQYDYQLGEYVEGRFNSLFRYLTTKKLSWSSLDEVERANVKEAFAEFTIIVGAYLLYAALKSASDDDEDKKRLAYLLRISDRYLAEMTFFTPFEISGKHQILISPAPTISTFESWGRLLSDVTSYLITSDVKEEEKLEKKIPKRLVRVVPSLSQPVRFIDEVLYEQTEEHK